MREYVKVKEKSFAALNDLALQDEIVVFGSTYMAGFPFDELINKCRLEHAVYNRSIEGMSVQEAEEVLNVAVLALHPRKVFLCFSDIGDGKSYGRLIKRIQEALPHAKIYVVSNGEDGAEQLCDGRRVQHVKLDSFGTQTPDYRRAFKQLCCFFRDRAIEFSEAFSMLAL